MKLIFKTMAKLTELDILDLLDEYNSELRKFQYKAEYVQERIKELDAQLRELKEENLQRKKELLIKSVSKVQTTNEDPSTKRKPYPLSDWDKAILDTLKNAQKIMVSSELLDSISRIAQEKGFYKDDNHAKIKLNQCLVKLANRRDDLIKLHHRGRGFAYALPEWMEGNHLNKKYQA